MMYPISVEIYSESAANGILYKPALTQAWNTVHPLVISILLMHPISVEIYSENAAIGLFTKLV